MIDAKLENWIQNRPDVYGQLFDDGQTESYEVDLEPQTVALSALARNTTLEGRVRLTEYPQMEQTAQGVDEMIDASRSGLFGDGDDIFAGLEPDGVDELNAATTSIICHWERACNRRGRLSPFRNMVIEDLQPDDNELPETRLVLMTGAALLMAATVAPSRSHYTIPKWSISAIKFYGPNFTRDFLSGEDVTDALGEDGNRMSNLFTLGEKRGLLGNSGQTLLASMQKIADNHADISRIDLAQELGWSRTRTDAIFTQAAIREMCYKRRDRSFIDTAKRIRYLFDEVVTADNIAKELGITPEVAKYTFNHSSIHNIVISSPDADPIDKLRSILNLTREITSSYDISYPLAVWLAQYQPNQAHGRAQQIIAEQADRPRGVSPALWASIVARIPTPGDPRRIKLAVSSSRYWNFLNSVAGTGPIDYGAALIERVPDSSFAPERLLFEDDSLRKIKKAAKALVAAAGLSDEDTDALMAYHDNPDMDAGAPDSGILHSIDQVRKVVKEQHLTLADPMPSYKPASGLKRSEFIW